jgi:hypothetical protein
MAQLARAAEFSRFRQRPLECERSSVVQARTSDERTRLRTMRWPWERWAGVAGIVFVVLYVVGFVIGGEPPDTDADLVAHYSDSGERAKEMAAFFLIATAALAFVLFASGLRARLVGTDVPRTLAAIAWAGGIAYATLALAGNAISRATAAAAGDELFTLEPNAQRLFETAGFLLFVSAAFAAMLLVGAVAVGALRYAVLPRWLGWTSVGAAVLLPTAIGFIGFLVLFAWALAAGVALAARRSVTASSH